MRKKVLCLAFTIIFVTAIASISNVALVENSSVARSEPFGEVPEKSSLSYVSIQPNYFLYYPIQVESGMNITFEVNSSEIVDVYLMTPSQLSTFKSSGSIEYLYSYRGYNISANIGPMHYGTYYLVVYNDASNEIAYVSYQVSTIPIDVYSYYNSLPAPIGIVDYGVVNSSGVLIPYELLYKEAIGIANIYSIEAYNSTPPSGVSEYGASLQLNVVLQVNTTYGSYTYWVQNVPNFWTNNNTLFFVDNVWNFTSHFSFLTNQSVKGNGYVYVDNVGEDYYAYSTEMRKYTLPLNLKLAVSENFSSNAVYISFGYSLGESEEITWYDEVIIPQTGITSASFIISGFSQTPSGHFYDSELVFGGEGNREITNFTKMNAQLMLKYVLENETIVLPMSLYGFGSDTAEGADDLSTNLIDGIPTVQIGSGNFYPVFYSVNLSKLSAKIAISYPNADADVGFPIEISSQIIGGLPPYAYIIYVDGSPIYQLTSYSDKLNFSAFVQPLNEGGHYIVIEVNDSLGNSFFSNSYTINVNPDPFVFISANATETDVGVPISISFYAFNGTPQYTYSIYANGSLIDSGSILQQGSKVNVTYAPSASGVVFVVLYLQDSANFTVEKLLEIKVNNPPAISLDYARSNSDVGVPIAFTVNVSSGTPPFMYIWMINGTPVAFNTSQYILNATYPGSYYVKAIAKDSAGYEVSKEIKVDVNPDPVMSNFTYISSSSNFLFENNKVEVFVSVNNGTPPYIYTWYLNGKIVSTSSEPEYTFSLANGLNKIQVKVTDSAGFSVYSSIINIVASYNYLALVGLGSAFILTALIIIGYLKKK
ncbi:MAG: hypothetical protein C0177_04185 [Fervidicoccus fontis]|uniref:Thermopsin n=1 Tax=Fervidicoccus fontis TaxID=683846 RepID=A0A2J6N746_9CREN|nr:MAG: hypothetical protein C0188_00520 [Fervidicoccus fontis]PMB77125.1 MAG: hypothetical protein C0177_04185 [Fervidicoccus fontis]